MGIDNVRSGPIEGVKIVQDSELQQNGGIYSVRSGPAVPVFGYTTAQRGIVGGDATPVYIVSQAQVDSGQFRVIQQAAKPIGDLVVLGAIRTIRGRVATPVFLAGGTLS